MLLLATAILHALALLWESSSHSWITHRIWVTLSLPLSLILSVSLCFAFERFKVWLHTTLITTCALPPKEINPFLTMLMQIGGCWYWQHNLRFISSCCLCVLSSSQASKLVALIPFLSIYFLVCQVFLARVHKDIILHSGGQLGAKDAANQTPAHICASATLVAVIWKRDILPLVQGSTDISEVFNIVLLNCSNSSGVPMLSCFSGIGAALQVFLYTAGTLMAGPSYFRWLKLQIVCR